jgi:hypothetical protein
LSGIYTGDEMDQAETHEIKTARVAPPKSAIAPAQTIEPAKEVTEVQLTHIGEVLATIDSCMDLSVLRKIWEDEKELLDVAIDNMTIKDALGLRAKELA